MIQQKQTKGVSPVIGVILMVAITVIIAAVVANFVLGLAGNLEEDAEATLTTTQSVADFANQEYNVTVTISQMDTADYVVVKEQTEDEEVDVTHAGTENGDVDAAPDSPSGSASVSDGAADTKGGILVGPGDEAVVKNLDAGDKVQIYGGLDGSENLMQTYTVEGTLGA